MREGRLARQARAFLLFLACLLPVVSLSCVKLPRRFLDARGQSAPPVSQAHAADTPVININTASIKELEKLPGIGRGLAARIIAHRDEFGRFRRPEHVMMVRGISARRFLAMRALIAVE
jgi:competence protein ComEA